MFATILLAWGFLTLEVVSSPLSANETRQWTYSEIPASRSLVWYPCFNTFFCAVLDVPLDYLKPKGNRAFVPLIKAPATTKPYKGMILTNPGGPGGSGVTFIKDVATLAAPIVGSNYDLVSWEPRGVGYSIPAAHCNLSLPAPPTMRRSVDKIYGPEIPHSYYVSQYESFRQIGVDCEKSIGASDQAGPHMTTATVARDMVAILNAFAKSKEGKSCKDASLLNFWGFSYGSLLGQTFASMFPRRIGRVVLDGIVDADDYIAGTWQTNIQLADDTFSTFFLYCAAAGPSKCPFYTGTTPHDIYLRFETILWQLDAIEAEKQNLINADVIQLALLLLRDVIFGATYDPIYWFPTIASILVEVEAILPNLTMEHISELVQSFSSNDTSTDFQPQFELQAIACSDNGGKLYNRTIQDSATNIQILRNQSYFGSNSMTSILYSCAGWPIVSDYTFSGPFGGKTKKPILFVSTTLDPVTPITNAKKATSLFKRAELLTIEGVGHTSLSPTNKCAYRKINRYFQTGALPRKNNYCPLEAGPWNITLAGSLSKRKEIEDISYHFKGMRSTA